MELTEDKRMYHLLLRKEGTERLVPMEALAASEEAAKEYIPAGFEFVRFTDRYYWPVSGDDPLPDGPPPESE